MAMDNLSNLKEDLAYIDKVIEEQEHLIVLSKALQDLISSKAYKLVIEGAYIEQESKDVLEKMLSPIGNDFTVNTQMLERIAAIRHLRTFLTVTLPSKTTNAQEVHEDSRRRREELIHKLESLGGY